MPDVVHPGIQKDEFRDVLLDELEIRIAAEVRDVVHRARHKVVYTHHLMSA